MELKEQTSDLVSVPEYAIKIQRDVKITMRDGIRLSANIFLPDQPGCYPVIFVRMPYGFSGRRQGEFYARRGYGFVMQDCRGRYDSEGEFYPFRDDAQDGLDSLDWICAQLWCNGRIGMFGPSYLASVQWALAPLQHPALQALVPNVMPTDLWKNGYWRNGAFSLALSALWTCLEISSRSSDLDMIPAYDLNSFFSHLPLLTLDQSAGRPSQIWQDFINHSSYDAYWQELSPAQDCFNELTVPAYIMGGWYDYYPGDNLNTFNQLRQRAQAKAREQSRILIGPWSHLISQSTRLGELDFGPKSQLDIDELALRWFDCLLKDKANGILDEPPVRIFVMGINQWRFEEEWPLARTVYTDFFLHSQGQAGSSLTDGRLDRQKPASEVPDTYIYDPQDPVPTLGGNHSICWPDAFAVIQPGPFDQRPVEERPDVLTYTTDILLDDTEVTGPIVLYLYASTDAPDTDWTAKLLDVSPDGRAINLTEGNIRARFRQSLYKAPQLLLPGKVYEYRIELQPTSNVFLAGQRIRLEVSSSNFPLWDRNPNTGHSQGQDAELRPARQTIYHDAKYPSRLLLPLIP